MRLTLLLDAIFSAAEGADDLDWVGVLTSCSAFEAYCKVYTADLRPEQVAEFLLLNPEFPYTIRYSTERMRAALDTVDPRVIDAYGIANRANRRSAARLPGLRADWRYHVEGFSSISARHCGTVS